MDGRPPGLPFAAALLGTPLSVAVLAYALVANTLLDRTFGSLFRLV